MKKKSFASTVNTSRIFGFILLIGIAYFTFNTETLFAETPTPTTTSTVTPTGSKTPTPTEKSSNKKQGELEEKIKEYEEKISGLRNQAQTLDSQIQLVDSQISVAELRVQETEKKIAQLEDDIEVAKTKVLGLETNIQAVSKAMVQRVSATYAFGKIDPLQMLLSSDTISNFLTRLKYLQVMQLYDKRQIYAAEQAKRTYAQEQSLFEEKQAEAESLREQLAQYNVQLESEKNKKKELLVATNNDEKKYQQLLASARAEYQSIQGIIAGRGVETEVGSVSEGERIASIIQGASCNSSGTHLHFIVKSGNNSNNPFNYLKSVEHTNNTGGDPFNPSGSWNWPIATPIQYNQGYGETWAVRNTWVGNVYRFHDGIDISTKGSQTVRAVKSGTLYQGSYAGSGGCRLRYVKVDHDDDGYETLYLHVNY